jgi:hypothetical protein
MQKKKAGKGNLDDLVARLTGMNPPPHPPRNTLFIEREHILYSEDTFTRGSQAWILLLRQEWVLSI